MQTGIILEKTAARPFAVSLANGLPEEIRRDDVDTGAMLDKEIRIEDIEALRDEQDQLYEKFLAEDKAIRCEIEKRIAQAQAAGFDTKGWGAMGDPEEDFDAFKGFAVGIVGGGVIWLLGYFLLKFFGVL